MIWLEGEGRNTDRHRTRVGASLANVDLPHHGIEMDELRSCNGDRAALVGIVTVPLHPTARSGPFQSLSPLRCQHGDWKGPELIAQCHFIVTAITPPLFPVPNFVFAWSGS